MSKKKKYPVIIYIVLALLVTAWAAFGVYGFLLDNYEIDLKGIQQIKADAYLGKGVEYTFAPKDKDATVTEEQFNATLEKLSKRISGVRGIEIVANSGEKTISVFFPSSGDETVDMSYLTGIDQRYYIKAVIAEYTAKSDGGYVIDKELETIFDSDDIEGVEVSAGTSSSSYYYILNLKLSEEAQAKLAEVTERVYNEAKAKAEADAEANKDNTQTADAESGEGENEEDKKVEVPTQRYFLLLDGEVVQNFTFKGKVEAETVVFGNYSDYTSLVMSANFIDIGPLEYTIERASVVYTSPVYGNLLDVMGVALIIVTVLAFAFFAIYGRAAGVVAGIIWLMQNSIVFIVYAMIGRIYSIEAIFGFAAAIAISFAMTAYMLQKLKAEYKKGKTVEGAVVYSFTSMLPVVRTAGWGMALLGIVLLFLNAVCIDLGVIFITAGVSLLVCLIYVTKWCLVSTQAFGFMRNPALFKNKKEAE